MGGGLEINDWESCNENWVIGFSLSSAFSSADKTVAAAVDSSFQFTDFVSSPISLFVKCEFRDKELEMKSE